jgi:hypothetical protein
MTLTDIEVDLDRAAAHTQAPTVSTWLDQPKLVAGVIAALGVVAIAAAAIVVPAVTGKPAQVAAAPAAPACIEAAGVAPLPAFAITEPTAGDIPAYHDTGMWTWRQTLLLPADVGAQAGRRLVQLQTGSTTAATVDVQTAGDQLLALKTAGRELTVQYPAATFGGWVELRVSSTDHPDGDLLAMSIVTASGRTGQVLKLPVDAHSALTGFVLSTPLGSSADVQYGPPTMTTSQAGC